MKTLVWIALMCGLVACASHKAAESERANKEQAIRDLIAVRGLPETPLIRGTDNGGWTKLERHFVLFSTRRDVYLLEFARACHELDDNEVTPDLRSQHNTIQARFDTLRGCRIHRIYALTEADAEELSDIGEAPGSRN